MFKIVIYRILVFLGTIISSLILLPEFICAQIPGSPENLTAYQKLSVDIFRELIEINTTVNMGSTKAVEAMASRLKDAGFPETEIHIAGPSPHHMNLVFRLKGKGTMLPILFIGHLDVVEALRQDWSFDPFYIPGD